MKRNIFSQNIQNMELMLRLSKLFMLWQKKNIKKKTESKIKVYGWVKITDSYTARSFLRLWIRLLLFHSLLTFECIFFFLCVLVWTYESGNSIEKWKDINIQANRTNTIIYKLDDIERANQKNLNKKTKARFSVETNFVAK